MMGALKPICVTWPVARYLPERESAMVVIYRDMMEGVGVLGRGGEQGRRGGESEGHCMQRRAEWEEGNRFV